MFSHSVVSASLWPHGLQHTRLPSPSYSPGVCSNSCPLNQWCHPTIMSSVTLFSSCLQSFPVSGFCSVSFGSSHQVAKVLELQLQRQSFQCVFWVDFLKDWLVWYPCSQESSPAQFESINSSALSLLYGSSFTSIHDYWKNHSFDYMDLCQQSDVSAF